MPRLEPVKPWYWGAGKKWVVQWKGQRHPLTDPCPKTPATEREATRAFRKMMADAERAAAEGPAVEEITLGELVYLYRANLRQRFERGEITEGWRTDCRMRLAGFVEMALEADERGRPSPWPRVAEMPYTALKPHHVEKWLNTRTDWKATSRAHGVKAVKGVLSWAHRAGLIESNPIGAMSLPKSKRRRAVPSPQTVAEAFEHIRKPAQRDLLEFLAETGCRPSEATRLEAAHINFELGVATLDVHKTSKTTDRPRVIYLSARAAEIARRLCLKNPEGPIFRNIHGKAWTKRAITQVFARLRERSGAGQSLTAYTLRHRFITDALAGGANPSHVAELVGHATLQELATYTHLTGMHDVLRESVGKIRGDGGGNGQAEPAAEPRARKPKAS